MDETAPEIKHRKTLLALFIPIFFETLFLMLEGIADTLMLSSVGDDAVGAVGTANAYIGMFFIFFGIISSGLVSVMTQYVGSEKRGVAYQALRIAILINGGIGVTLSVVLGFAAGPIIDALGVPANLRDNASTYLRIIGSVCFLDALVPVFSCYLRAFNKARLSLAAALSGNAVNIILNAVSIYAIRNGNPVVGVAFGTVIGKAVNLALCVIFGRFLVKAHRYKDRLPAKSLIRDMFRVGLPAAVETGIYFAAMAVVTMILNRCDTDGFNATVRTYATQFTNFAYCAAFALAQANVILVGWAIGRGDMKSCYRSTLRTSLIAIGTGVAVETVLAFVSPLALGTFTSNQSIIDMVRWVLLIDIALEVGRATNLVYGQTLKSTGDAIFPAIIAAIFNLLLAVGGTYLFAYVLNLKVIGVFISLAADEVIRAWLMILRWRSGKWEKKVIVKAKEEEPLA